VIEFARMTGSRQTTAGSRRFQHRDRQTACNLKSVKPILIGKRLLRIGHNFRLPLCYIRIYWLKCTLSVSTYLPVALNDVTVTGRPQAEGVRQQGVEECTWNLSTKGLMYW